ncbi:MAG: flagellar hook-associated protein FlgK [Zetaproteobacteria bacterium]|nr:flagellar hook-associated protein FlgK [Zetaproteobacteria bacterium]
MSAFAGLHIASSSLTTFQRAIDVTSHNISNANTAGYSVQTAAVATAPADNVYGMAFGRGVQMGSITRAYDENIFKGLVASDGNVAYFTQMQNSLKSIEGSMGTLDATATTQAMDDFFAAWQSLSHSPADPVAQSGVVAAAQNIQMQVSRMGQSIDNVMSSIDGQVNSMLTDVNLQLDQIVTLNQKIVSAMNTQNQQFQANDAMDLRDNLIRKISQVLPITVVPATDGSVTINLNPPSNGSVGLASVALVGGTDFAKSLSWDGTQLSMTSKITGNTQPVIGFDLTGAQTIGFTGGGKIGALLDMKSKDYLTQLNNLVSNMVFEVNKLTASGAGNTSITSYASGQLSGLNTAFVDSAVAVPFASQIQAGTFNIHVLDSLGVPVAGSPFNITITPGVSTMATIAADINAQATAAGGGVTAAASANGQLTINGDPDLLNGGTNRVIFGQDSSNFLAAYEMNTMFHGSVASNLQVDSALINDPSRLSVGNADPLTSAFAVGNNDIAVQMVQMKDVANTITGGNALTLNARVEGLVSSFGRDLNDANTRLTFHKAEATVIQARRDEVSAVNVDDQMIKIMEFQRSYQAAAKLVSTTEKMLDSLMGLVR